MIIAINRTDSMVDRARVVTDSRGGVHVGWTEFAYPETLPPLGVRYAHSRDQGTTWSVPLKVNGPYDYVGMAVIEPDKIHMVWSGTNPDRRRFHRWSRDGGITWSEIWRNPRLGGYQGWPALAVDSEQTLY
jgi:hypothetical protein